ncbi:hypothetical protein GCK72_021091 [Caenorhabditis remanei]|uniref:Uncharacterized protein n=1 Tax=Caenorhabditis remanei TaxID=31234 RepID=A0A6A5GH64_CAERE|nr:hypothetical protein GCK72_021091 [Caenorhabditis remanei]KAF1754528.1 hypothetical protein GCK72_021091 [Caenorhabditis remanei]
MLPGVVRPINFPPNYAPLPPGYVEFNLASHLLMLGRIEHVSPQTVRSLNQFLQEMEPVMMWNSCNGCLIGAESELSLDATPTSHSFYHKLAAKYQARRRLRFTTVKRYFEDKYKITLSYPNSPLLRDPSGSMFPIECVWVRFRVR